MTLSPSTIGHILWGSLLSGMYSYYIPYRIWYTSFNVAWSSFNTIFRDPICWQDPILHPHLGCICLHLEAYIYIIRTPNTLIIGCEFRRRLLAHHATVGVNLHSEPAAPHAGALIQQSSWQRSLCPRKKGTKNRLSINIRTTSWQIRENKVCTSDLFSSNINWEPTLKKASLQIAGCWMCLLLILMPTVACGFAIVPNPPDMCFQVCTSKQNSSLGRNGQTAAWTKAERLSSKLGNPCSRVHNLGRPLKGPGTCHRKGSPMSFEQAYAVLVLAACTCRHL